MTNKCLVHFTQVWHCAWSGQHFIKRLHLQLSSLKNKSQRGAGSCSWKVSRRLMHYFLVFLQTFKSFKSRGLYYQNVLLGCCTRMKRGLFFLSLKCSTVTWEVETTAVCQRIHSSLKPLPVTSSWSWLTCGTYGHFLLCLNIVLPKQLHFSFYKFALKESKRCEGMLYL